jgi:hypothetical protein
MALTAKAKMREVQEVAIRASERKVDSSRHKCFLSYRVTDMDEVESFLDDFGTEFIPRSVGVTEEDDFIESDDDAYIKRRIRELYLIDSTVTILLVGSCSWSRKFIDWELSSSLRNDSVNRRNGLLAIGLPSADGPKAPARLKDNWVFEKPEFSYALFKKYPRSASGLRARIEEAFLARTEKASLVDNTRALRKNNSACP